MSGFGSYTTDVLQETRTRLLSGLAKVHAHIVAGDVDIIQEGHSSSPRDAGFITLILLDGCEAELTRRKAL